MQTTKTALIIHLISEVTKVSHPYKIGLLQI